ncbi:MAG: hypothetical protein P4L90_11615 [Rhodopila sp.]|nr:hypothetical protein [Rhodopila sp.]
MSEPVRPGFLSHVSALRDPRQAMKMLYPAEFHILGLTAFDHAKAGKPSECEFPRIASVG